jgi:hypothetical protein
VALRSGKKHDHRIEKSILPGANVTILLNLEKMAFFTQITAINAETIYHNIDF